MVHPLQMKRDALLKLRSEAKGRVVGKMFPHAKPEDGAQDEKHAPPAPVEDKKQPGDELTAEKHASVHASMGMPPDEDGVDGLLGEDPEKVLDEDKKAKLLAKLLALAGE